PGRESRCLHSQSETFSGTKTVVGNQSQTEQSKPAGHSRSAGRRWPACRRADRAIEPIWPFRILGSALGALEAELLPTPKGKKGSHELAPPDSYEIGSTVEDAIFCRDCLVTGMRFAFLVYLFGAVTSLHAEKP